MSMEIEVKLVTKNNRLAVPEAPSSVPINVTPDDLNKVVCQLLSENVNNKDVINDNLKFDFLINNELLRLSLKEHLEERSIDAEGTIQIEYIEKYPAPKPKDSLQHNDWVSRVHTNQNWILAACYDKSINVWSVSGKKFLQINDHDDIVKTVTWIDLNDDFATFASGSFDQTVRLWKWNRSNNEYECFGICRGHEGTIEALDVSPDREMLLSAGYDTLLKLWTIDKCNQNAEVENQEPNPKRRKTNSLTRTPLKTMKGHKEAIMSVRWSKRNELVCTASMDHTIKFWDLELGGIKSEIVGSKSFFDVDLSIFNDLVISASCDRYVRLYDTRYKDGSIVKAPYSSHTQWVVSVRWSKSNENLFVSGSFDSEVKLWDIRSINAPLYNLSGNQERIFSVDWSNSKYIVSGGADNLVNIYQTKNI